MYFITPSIMKMQQAFSSYARLIPKFFNTHGFGPPLIFT